MSKAKDCVVYLDDDDIVPEGATLIQVEEVFSHWEQEKEGEYHYMQTPAQWKVNKKRYTYKLKEVRSYVVRYMDFEIINEIGESEFFSIDEIINIETIPDPDRVPFNMYRVWYKEEV